VHERLGGDAALARLRARPAQRGLGLVLDERRAAATFPDDRHEASATIRFLSPGLRFFHQGQLQGRTKRISHHLGRGPDAVFSITCGG
jgi:hypothetical protein